MAQTTEGFKLIIMLFEKQSVALIYTLQFALIVSYSRAFVSFRLSRDPGM